MFFPFGSQFVEHKKASLGEIYVWVGSTGKESAAILEIQEMWVQSLGWEDPLKKEMATHFSILAWEIPQTEEPSRVQSVKSHRVRQN